jgi:hypothetical protein
LPRLCAIGNSLRDGLSLAVQLVAMMVEFGGVGEVGNPRRSGIQGGKEAAVEVA